VFVRVGDTNWKGAVAEAKIVAEATELEIPVLRPLAEHSRYDLVFEIGERLLRVQCKWGRLDSLKAVVMVEVGSSWCTPTGYVRTQYSEHEIDLLAVYCGELDRCYLLPSSLAVDRRAVHLRLVPPKNGQRACINLASDYDFEGAVAQLGERLRGTQEAVGSSPISSTPSEPLASVIGAHEFRNRFGYHMELAAAGEEVLVTRHGKPAIRLVAAAPALGPAASTGR
jgi:prevent-host-death family protein